MMPRPVFKLTFQQELPRNPIFNTGKDAVLNAASSLSNTAKLALQVAADKACGTNTASKGSASQVAASQGAGSAASGAYQDRD